MVEYVIWVNACDCHRYVCALFSGYPVKLINLAGSFFSEPLLLHYAYNIHEEMAMHMYVCMCVLVFGPHDNIWLT